MAKETLDELVVSFDLAHELLRILKRSQRVGVSLGEELHTAGVGEFFQRFDEFGHIVLQLFYGSAGD